MRYVCYYIAAVIFTFIGYATCAILSASRDDDARPPLRCFQCRHYYEYQDMPFCEYFGTEDPETEGDIAPLGFCSYGERVEP